ncbi:MAG: hypothetical protein R3B96_18810 [Pirellulaceae bacterium]|nr:hypothetical protein [Planctomycetales bacterium]
MSFEHETDSCPWPYNEVAPVAEAPIESLESELPDPLTDLSGWLESSLQQLEQRFASFVTQKSSQRAERGSSRR